MSCLSSDYSESGSSVDPCKTPENQEKPDPEHFLKLAKARMPFGKYAGRFLADLPEHYLVWFSQKGFPDNDLGRMMQEILEIKLNGLEYLLRPFR